MTFRISDPSPKRIIIDSDVDFEKLYEKVELTSEIVDKSAKRSQPDAK